MPVPAGPCTTTLVPRSTKPQVESSVTFSRSNPRFSEKPIDLTSASGYLSPARFVRLRTFWLMNVECASPAAIWILSEKVSPAHMSSSWALSASTRSSAPVSRSLRAVSASTSITGHNAHPFQKREGSRDSVFREAEAGQLRPLPDVRYDAAEWVYNRSVNLDFHVVYARNRYTVPYRYAGRKVDLRVGESTPSIYHAGERIATHKLLPSYVRSGYSTDEFHMPGAFLRPEWDDAGIRGWAKRVGPSCAAVMERIFGRAKFMEQAYTPAPSALNPSNRYGEECLEVACAHALPKLMSPRYKHLKAILDSGLDEPLAARSARHPRGPESDPRGHVRRADYYRE